MISSGVAAPLRMVQISRARVNFAMRREHRVSLFQGLPNVSVLGFVSDLQSHPGVSFLIPTRAQTQAMALRAELITLQV